MSIGTSDPGVVNLANEMQALHSSYSRFKPPPLPDTGKFEPPPRAPKAESVNDMIDRKVGKDSVIGKSASNLSSINSGSSAIGGGINSLYTFRDMFERDAAASSLLDRVIDGSLEPDVEGYTQGSPDTPTSLCSRKQTDVDECGKCFAAAGESLTAARYNLEKLRAAGASTKDYVSSRLAIGDGLSGATGLAALEWQKQRSGINKQFDKFKGTYDAKYAEMMKGLQTAMTRFDSCESQFGESDWYNRFGFLYVQFMADKYKRNF